MGETRNHLDYDLYEELVKRFSGLSLVPSPDLVPAGPDWCPLKLDIDTRGRHQTRPPVTLEGKGDMRIL